MLPGNKIERRWEAPYLFQWNDADCTNLMTYRIRRIYVPNADRLARWPEPRIIAFFIPSPQTAIGGQGKELSSTRTASHAGNISRISFLMSGFIRWP